LIRAYAGVGWSVLVGRGVSVGLRVDEGVKVGRLVGVWEGNIISVLVGAIRRVVRIPSRIAVTRPVKMTRAARASTPAKKGKM